MNTHITLLILCVSSLFSVGCAAQSETQWHERCVEAKERFSKENFNNVTYTSLPKSEESLPFFTLVWSGLDVPLPQADYKDVLLNYENDNDISIIFVTKNGLRIHIHRFYDNSEIENIFEIMGELSSKEQMEWTKNALGKPVRMSDLIDLGYRTTLEDVSCDVKKQARESVELVSLVLKSNSNSVAAHELSVNNQSWVEVRQLPNDDNKTYTVSVIDANRGNNELKQIDYILPKNGNVFNLYAKVMLSKSNPSKNPEWLNALNVALETRAKKDWDNYFSIAEKSNISQKSITASKNSLFK